MSEATSGFVPLAARLAAAPAILSPRRRKMGERKASTGTFSARL
jgi:hypothetical protein